MTLDYRLQRIPPHSARQATGWLLLATMAVAASSLFAILLVLARVPALGKLFPGDDFYRVALTLHVDLSQTVWFMAFAGVLWSLAAPRPPRVWESLALGLCAAGALTIALSPALGALTPIMSNYVPVLDSPVFLAGLLAFGAGFALQALRALWLWPSRLDRGEDAVRAGLSLAALCSLIALALLTWSALSLAKTAASGYAYFEWLFWGAGHVWQFVLTTLMLLAWLWLASSWPAARGPRPAQVMALLALGALPAVTALLVQAVTELPSTGYRIAFTRLMQWTSWEVPLILGLWLIPAFRASGRRDGAATAFALSLGLFVCGLLLGASIGGENTLVTAHYHGTIGAVTLGFMGLTYALLPKAGYDAPGARWQRAQLSLYGYGILLMMAGLAGAGWMGAPRKAAGNVQFEFGVETAARLVMGVGGLLATAGIILFLVLVSRSLAPVIERLRLALR